MKLSTLYSGLVAVHSISKMMWGDETSIVYRLRGQNPTSVHFALEFCEL